MRLMLTLQMEATGKRAEAHSLIWRMIYRKIDSSPSP